MISYAMSKINQMRKEQEQVGQKIINGVNVTKLFDAMGAIMDNPSISQFNFRAKRRWINGGHNQTSINDFYGAC
jgi:hypothetical protein